VTHRALVIGAGNAGKAHAEALASLGIDVVGPLSGTATVADAPLRDPAVHNGVEIRSGQIGNLHPSLDGQTLRARSIELARSGRVVLGGLPRHELPVEEASAGFAARRRPAEVLQVVFRYV
jgi:hypothetical protein